MMQLKLLKKIYNVFSGTRYQQFFHISAGKLISTIKFSLEKKLKQFELLIYLL